MPNSHRRAALALVLVALLFSTGGAAINRSFQRLADRQPAFRQAGIPFRCCCGRGLCAATWAPRCLARGGPNRGFRAEKRRRKGSDRAPQT